jgi:hypothetical protein
MGMGILNKSCAINYAPPSVPISPSNPDPKRWQIVSYVEHPAAYVLLACYLDCTTYEGLKVMVYRGKFPGRDRMRDLDPHFRDDDSSPIARFRPDPEGMRLANELAERLS